MRVKLLFIKCWYASTSPFLPYTCQTVFDFVEEEKKEKEEAFNDKRPTFEYEEK